MNDIPASFWDHIEELRRILISILILIGLGILLSLFFFLQFIAPGMRKREKNLLIPFFGLSLLFLGLGLLLAFFVTIPLANQYLYSYNDNIGLNLWSFSYYLDYTIILLMANALAFEF